MKQMMLRYVQPVMVAAVLLFWAFAPPGWTGSAWSIVIATLTTTAVIQALEWVNERHSSWRLTWREFGTDVFYVTLSYTVIAWASKTLADAPLAAIKQSLGITTLWATHLPFVAQVALAIFLVEFGQYWMHRLMHDQAFFWSTHAPHHHLTQLNAMKGAVGNPIELFLISLSVLALFDLATPAVFCALNILAVVSTFAHANTRFDPPRWYAFVFTTIRHHSLHHSTGYAETRCNYGNSLILLDRLFGTYAEGEAEIVGQGERRRLSIREQFLFPAQPLIARFGARNSAADHTSLPDATEAAA